MQRFFYENLEHILCLAILVGRIGDIASTYLASPRLILEANPLVRRWRWPFAALTLLLCLVPYWSPGPAVPIAVASLLITSDNLRLVWLSRALGEEGYLDFLRRAAQSGSLGTALCSQLGSSFFLVLVAGLLFCFYAEPGDWAFWYALGILAFGIAVGLHRSLFLRKLFREAEARDAL